MHSKLPDRKLIIYLPLDLLKKVCIFKLYILKNNYTEVCSKFTSNTGMVFKMSNLYVKENTVNSY